MSQHIAISGGLAAGSRPVEYEEKNMADIEAPEVGGNGTPNIYYRENWGLAARVDPSVTFEEYVYWAKIERDLERESNQKYMEKRGPASLLSLFKDRFSKGIHHEAKKEAEREAATRTEQEGEKGVVASSGSSSAVVHEEEWRIAARALRTSGWGTVFYLITTDILGWGSTP